MVTEIRTLRVSAEMDASKYAAGAAQKVAADKGMAASGKEAAAAFTQHDQKISASGNVLARLSRQYVDGYASAQRFNSAINQLSRGVELGKIEMTQASVILDGIYKKYGLMADASQLAQRGQIDLARAVEQANAKLAAQKNVLPANQNGIIGRGQVGSFNTANIAAQFQDIGVTAAMGMSPLQIALQQGTQLSAVLNSMERPVAGLAAAFTSLINPTTLVTMGVIAAGTALIQYFTSAESGAEKTSKLLKEQNDIIRSAAKAWGDATPSLKAYVEQLDQVDKITQGREASEILAGRSLDGLGDELAGLNRQFIGVMRTLQGHGADPAFVRDFRDAFGELREKLDDGTASIGDLNAAQSQLTTAVATYGTKEVLTFRDAWDQVTSSIFRGVEAARKAREEWIAAIAGAANVQDILSGATFTEGGRVYQTGSFIPRVPGVPTGRPLIELDGDPDPTTITNSDGRVTGVPIPGTKPNYFELEIEKEKLDEVTKAYLRAQEAKANFWLDLSFQERQAGRSALDQQVASTLVRYGLDENLNSSEANAIRNQIQTMQMREAGREAIGGFLSDFRSALENNGGDIGKAFGEAIANALMNQANKITDRIFENLTNALTGAIFGTGGSVGIGGMAPAFKANTTLGEFLGMRPANDNAPSGDMRLFREAISAIESGGNYSALGPITRNGDRAYGRYQMMGNNIGPWSQAALGRPIGTAEFLANPALQDQIFDHRFGSYVSRYGPTGAAKAWFGGPGAVNSNGNAMDVLGTSVSQYAAKFDSAVDRMTTSATSATGSIADLATTSGTATQGLGQFGNGLGQMGQALASGGSGGGGGGFFDWLSGLFGGGSQWSQAVAGTLKPGLFADGTPFAPGGMAIVGERGRELINLPRGSQVIPNHNTERLLRAANGNGGGTTVEINIINNSGAKVEQRERQTANGKAIDVMIDEAVAQKINTPGSHSRGAMQGQFNLRGSLARR